MKTTKILDNNGNWKLQTGYTTFDEVSGVLNEILDKLRANELEKKEIKNKIAQFDNEISSYKGTVLYDDSSGDTGDITLDDNIQNYKFIKIYGKNSGTSLTTDQVFVAQSFFTNNLSTVELQLAWNTNGNGIVYPCGTTYVVNNKSMTVNHHYRIGLYGTNQGYESQNNSFAITKIIGYEED